VADQRGDGGERRCCRTLFGEASCKPDGGRSFGDIERQSQDSRGGTGDARDVGGADIAAARFSDVTSGKQSARSKPNGIEPRKYAAARRRAVVGVINDMQR